MRKALHFSFVGASPLAITAAQAASMRRKEAPDLERLLKDHTGAVEAALEETKSGVEEVKTQLLELQQKAARGGGFGFGGSGTSRTIGQSVVEDEHFKSFVGAKMAGRLRVEVKTITSGSTSGGPIGPAPYRDEVAPLARPALTMRDLVTVIPVTTGTIEYPRQTTRENNSATVGEGNLKPSSEFAWEMVTVPARTIAHWTLAARQILDDAPQLQALVDSDLRFGLAQTEDMQILLGAGSGTDLYGIYPQATAFSAPFVPAGHANQEIDVVGLALLQANNTNYPADGIVLHPTDWMRMRLLKSSQGEYILGDPQEQIVPTLFGLPVVLTQGMAAGTFLVGAFKQGATLYDRQEAVVLISTEDSDNFRRNLVTLLAEERVGLAVKRPSAFIKGNFATIIAALNA